MSTTKFVGTGGLKIRNLTIADVHAVAGIEKKLDGRIRPEYWRKKLEEYTTDPEACVGVEVKGKLVGFIIGHVKGGVFGTDDDIGWVEVMAVDPDYQGSHLGQLLAQTLFDYFRSKGIKNIHTLCDWKETTILGFFSALGFTKGDYINLQIKL
jgi:ribosomal protein S18 acetylase RimI-like enzyme